jgi:galactitol-specific phosphotransferase system IIC component
MENYRKYIFLGIIIISLGIVFSTTLQDSIKSLGTVLIAVGGLFFIIGMSKKNKEK